MIEPLLNSCVKRTKVIHTISLRMYKYSFLLLSFLLLQNIFPNKVTGNPITLIHTPSFPQSHIPTFPQSPIPTFPQSHIPSHKSNDYLSQAIQQELNRDIKALQKTCKEWLDSGEYSPGLLQYNYNVLIGLAPNAILITNGENDTYPLWLLQHGKNVRKDIIVMNRKLLLKTDYLNALLTENEIPPFPSEEEVIFQKNEHRLLYIIKHIILHRQSTSLYFASTLSKELTAPFSSKLFNTGLAFVYSDTRINNVDIIQNNFEENFLTDYLKVNFAPDPNQELVNQLNFNYVPPLILITHDYEARKLFKKAQKSEQLALEIATQINRVEEVKELFDTPPYYILIDKSQNKEAKTITIHNTQGEHLIINVQTALYKQGYNPGPIDNIFGEKTQNALYQFQIDHKLPLGKMDKQTLKVLFTGNHRMIPFFRQMPALF